MIQRWETKLVATLRYPAAEMDHTAAALLARRGRPADDGGGVEVNDIDLTLTGWPWAEKNLHSRHIPQARSTRRDHGGGAQPACGQGLAQKDPTDECGEDVGIVAGVY